MNQWYFLMLLNPMPQKVKLIVVSEINFQWKCKKWLVSFGILTEKILDNVEKMKMFGKKDWTT